MKLKIFEKKYSDSEVRIFSARQLRTAVWNGESEFTLGGKKFDVISARTVAGAKVYRCLFDSQDSAIQPVRRLVKTLIGRANQNSKIDIPAVSHSHVSVVFVLNTVFEVSFGGSEGIFYNRFYASELKVTGFSSKLLIPPKFADTFKQLIL